MAIYESTWWKLARREYRLKMVFFLAKCPGGCDFRWLTFLLAGVLCMALLLLSTQDGLMNNFVETLVGKIPNHGVPIWVVATNGHDIDATNLSKIKKIAPVFPYRDVSPGKIHIPGHRDSDTPGRAVHVSDPLWQLPATSQPIPEHCFPQVPSDGTDKLPLEVTLNKSWFKGKNKEKNKNNFDYTAYRQALENRLPSPCIPAPTSSLESMQVLWLDVELREHELVPFKIRWVEQIPAMEKLAFLFPMRTYHTILVSKDLPKLRYYPEMQGGDEVRVREVVIEKDNLDKKQQQEQKAFITCTNGKRHDDVIQFPNYLPVYWIQACADAYTQYWHNEAHNGDKIRHDAPWDLSLPCNRLNDLYKRMLNHQACAQNPYANVLLNMLINDFRVSHALVYARDYTELSEIKDKLLQLRENGEEVLYLHDIYQKSIDRFDFLADSLETLLSPYVLIFVLFLLLLLGVNIGTLIDHRQHSYGIFLAKGMPANQIYYMVSFQMILVTMVGFVLALIAFLVVMFIINYLVFADVVETHRDNLDIIGTLYLLPFDWLYLLVLPVGILFTIGIAALHLHSIPLRRDTAPSELLQS
jgi:hypothetical protein